MPLIETEGMVIKSYNLAEADRIVVFLTRDHGVVRGVAKGAKRLRSKFGSGLEPFSVVHLTYFQKDAVELVSVRKLEIVRSYFASAGDPSFLGKFSYLADLLTAFSPPNDPNETLFRMVSACLESGSEDTAYLPAIGVYFELWLLKISGYLPEWVKCGKCGHLFDEKETVELLIDFHLVCQQCRQGPGQTKFTKEHRELFRMALRRPPKEFVKMGRDFDLQLAELSLILKRIISQSLGHEVPDEGAIRNRLQ